MKDNRIVLWFLTALGAAAMLSVAAIPPRQDFSSDTSARIQSRSLEWMQASSQTLAWQFKTNSTDAQSLTGATAVVFYYMVDDGASMVAVTGSVENGAAGRVKVDFTPTDLNTNSASESDSLFDWRLEVTDSSDTLAYAYGKLKLISDPTSGVTNEPSLVTVLNWSDYEYLNTTDSGPIRPSGAAIGLTTNADGSVTWSIAAGAGITITEGTAIDVTTNGTGDYTINVDGTESFNASGATNLNGSSIASGTVADARIAATIARDSEVTAATNALYSLVSSDITTATNAVWSRVASEAYMLASNNTAAAGTLNTFADVAVTGTADLQGGIITNSAGSVITSAVPLVASSGLTLGDNINMGGNSITNIGTNSLVFSNGDKISLSGTNIVFTPNGESARILDGLDETDLSTINSSINANTASIGINKGDISRNENNILANRFLIQINGSLSAFDLDDGWSDQFEDQTGVDLSQGSNFTYDAAGDYYSWAVRAASGSLGSDLFTHYRMNDSNANTTVTDAGTNSYDATSTGNTDGFSTGGKITNALSLTDVGADGIVLPNEMTAWWNSWDTQDKSMCCWWRPDNADSQFRFILWASDADDTPRIGFYHNVSGNTVNFKVRDDAATEISGAGTYTATNGGWVHWCMTWDSTAKAANLYVNGVWNCGGTNGSSSTISQFANGDAVVGKSKATAYSDMTVDDVRFYNKVLTTDEIAAIYNLFSGTEDQQDLSYAGGNMELISTNSFSADATPTNARLLMAHEDVTGTATVNTDFKAYASSDLGTNWNEITLSSAGQLSSAINLYAGTNTLTGNSTNMAWKITSNNTNQAGRVHAVGLMWKEQ